MSSTSSRYLIDANVFIQAKNLYYQPNFCQCFWDWLIEAHQAKLVFSIDKVKTELEKGTKDDPILTWIELN